MKRMTLLVGIALTISGLFASQTFAASGCISAACDPAAAAAACDPAAAAADPACDPASAPTANCTQSAECAAPASCDPAAAAACNANCNSGCLSTAPGCGACSNCGCFSCNGLCNRHGCAEVVLGKLKKSLCEDVCWSGYMNAGYFTNFAGDRSNGYTDGWSNTTPAFNALYIAAEKKAYTGGCGYDIGFGVDFMFGEDSRFFRSSKDFDHSWYTGHMFDPLYYSYDTPSYGFAMPQLYLEAAINNWSVKLGHFNALLGYERATAPSRFFYSKGLTCVASPTSQTGVLATFNGFENLDVTLGWVSGWGCAYDNCGMFPNENTDESMITGAFTYHINEYAYLRYAFLAGTTTMDDVFGFMGPYAFYVADQYKGLGNAHSVVLDLQLTGRLESVSTLMYGDFRYGFNSDVLGAYYTILGQHLYYTLNCCWKVGFRGEWMNISNGVGTELTSFAIGANWHPAGNQNLYVRPELRYDRAIGGMSGEMLNYRPDQFTIGFDIMLTF